MRWPELMSTEPEMSRRLPLNPQEVLDRDQSFTFSFEGKTVEAFAGDTIASALAAQGRDVISRSFRALSQLPGSGGR